MPGFFGSAENTYIQTESEMRKQGKRPHAWAASYFCPESLPPITSSSNGTDRSFKRGRKQPRGFTSFDFTQQRAPSGTFLSPASLSREGLEANGSSQRVTGVGLGRTFLGQRT